MNQKRFINIIVIAIVILLAGAGIYFVLNRQVQLTPTLTPTPTSRAPASGPITVVGEITCLPKKGTGKQSLECAFGLKALDGHYYGLKNLFKLDPEYKFSVGGLRVEVSGTFKPEEMKGPDGNKYDVVGIIDVISIKKVAGGDESGTGTVQPEDPNKIGFAPYPDYPLTSIPSAPITVKYLVEHRSALDGKTITVRGVVVGILSQEAACPPGRGACGAPMIFLADSTKTDRDKYLDLGVVVSEEERGYTVGKNAEVMVVVSGSKTALNLAKVY